MSRLLYLIIITILLSCRKNIDAVTPTCEFYDLYTDQYYMDSTPYRTVLLSLPYSYVCKEELVNMKAYVPFVSKLCDVNNNIIGWERLRYVFNHAVSIPFKLKP